MRSTCTLVANMVKDTNIFTVYRSLGSPSLRDNLQIPDLIWHRLEPELKKRINQLRQEIHQQKEAKKRQSRTTNSFSPPCHGPPSSIVPPTSSTKVNAVTSPVEHDHHVAGSYSYLLSTDIDYNSEDTDADVLLRVYKTTHTYPIMSRNSPVLRNTASPKPDTQVRELGEASKKPRKRKKDPQDSTPPNTQVHELGEVSKKPKIPT